MCFHGGVSFFKIIDDFVFFRYDIVSPFTLRRKGNVKKQQHETIREELVKRRDTILANARKHMRELRSQEHRGCDGFKDWSDADETHLRLMLADQEHGELLCVDAAIKSIDDGIYGQCEACRRDIEPKRLRAVPFAQECCPCKTATEEVPQPALIARRYGPVYAT